MARPISWKKVIDESHKTFFLNRAQDNLSALIAVGLFQQRVRARGLEPDEAVAILGQSDLVKAFLAQADQILQSKQVSAVAYALEQKQKLENLEQSSRRIEDGISSLHSVSKDIQKASSDMRAESHALFAEMRQRSEDIKNATEKNAQASADINAATKDIAAAVGQVKTNITDVAEIAIQTVKNTSEEAAIQASIKAGKKLVWRLAPLTVALSVAANMITTRVDTPQVEKRLSVVASALLDPPRHAPKVPLPKSSGDQVAILPEPLSLIRRSSGRDSQP